jgi:uncharacterized protein
VTTSDLVVGVSDLLRRPGARRDVRRTLTSAGYEVGAAEVREGVAIEVDLVVEATAAPDTLAVSGTVEAPWVGECRRCLDPIEGKLVLDVRELFSRAPDAVSDEDVWPIEAEQIDVAAVVADAILLALPLAPLCGPDCRGPVPEAFESAEDTDDDLSADYGAPADPRWAALDELRFD